MPEFTLLPHPDFPSCRVSAVTVDVLATEEDILLSYVVIGDEALVVPAHIGWQRADDLWKTTCFELFLRPTQGSEYFEFNFSPTGQWAAYGFESYRAGRRDLPALAAPFLEIPYLTDHRAGVRYPLTVDLELDDVPSGPLIANVTAVIEETGGIKSYWALKHANGPPDFHNPDCFIATLPAPGRA